MTEIQMVRWWTQCQLGRVRGHDRERGDGILVWVVMTALLVVAAIAIVTIIVTKAKSTANNVKTQ